MYAWVEKYFLGHNVASSQEQAFTFEPQAELVCGLPPTNKTLKDIYQEWLERPTPVPQVPQSRDSVSQVQVTLRQQLRNLLGLSPRASKPVGVDLMVTSRADAIIKQLVVDNQSGIRLPAVEIDPRNRQPGATIMLLGKSAKNFPAIPELISRGDRVILIDLRGIGEINPGGGRTDNWAWFMGHPWPGLWVEDIESAVNAVINEYPHSPLGLIGFGLLGKAALFAAALDSRISAVVVQLDEATYREESTKGGLSDVPGILSEMDLPQIVGLVAPRPCWIQVREDLHSSKLQSDYTWSIELYQHLGSMGSLRLQSSYSENWLGIAKWFEDRL
jgi:hypothetical protein